VSYVMHPDPFNAGGLGMGFQGPGIGRMWKQEQPCVR